jgi:diadenosine tetraphosphate (Ap4A) HIT family hydrolase
MLAMAFALDPRLADSGIWLGRLGEAQVLLKNNAHFLWLVLVPEVEASVTELHHLPADAYGELCFSIRQLSEWVAETFDTHKVNVAAIGNIVRQLHVHIVGRYEGDVGWPGTVWACGESKPFAEAEIAYIRQCYQQRFG